MATPIGSITRAATRKVGEPLNIACFPTHERHDSGLSLTGHRFFALRAPGIKDWNTKYAPVPENYVLLNQERSQTKEGFNWYKQLPPDIDFDVVLSANKFGQFQLAKAIASQLHLPLISLEHTLPVPQWNKAQRESLRQMRGDINAFISEFSVNEWGWSPEDKSVRVVHHGVDTNKFSPNEMVAERKPTLLSVCNDWVNRDWCMPANQKILTNRGYISINKVKVGMSVLADDGELHYVTKIFARDYVGDMVTVKLDRDTELRFTPTHAVRVWRDGQWKYVESSRLRAGDTLRFPEHVQTDFSFSDENQAWLIGLIVGDGSITEGGNVSISFNVTERANAERALAIAKSWFGSGAISDRHRSRGKQAISVDATTRIFGAWLKPLIGGKAGEKRLPDFIMRGSKAVRLAALRGVWSADGSLKNGAGNSPRACFSTISLCLASQVSELLHGYGVKCSVRRFKRTTNKSNGKIVPIYRVVSYGKENVERCRWILENAIWEEASHPYQYEIKEVELEEEWGGKVYNCEVENDNSYVVAPGLVAHNCCGFKLWQEVTKELPVVVVGDTPGLSKPAASIPELVMRYRESRVFVNTSLISPIPTSLLEAMSCGCACVSTANCMIPEIIDNGVNGFLSNDPAELRHYCQLLLKDSELAKRLGKASRQTILDRFSMATFVANWQKIFEEASQIVFTGNR